MSKFVKEKSYYRVIGKDLQTFQDAVSNYGIFRSTDKEIILDPKYDEIERFHDGLAKVYDRFTKKYGFINDKGEEVIPLKYFYVSDFHEGLAKFHSDKSDLIGFIDTKGNTVIEPKYLDADNFQNGLSRVYDKSQHYGFIDKTGKEIIPCKYNFAGFFSCGLVRLNGTGIASVGYADTKGNMVIPVQYLDGEDFVNNISVVLSKEGKSKVIDIHNNVVLDVPGVIYRYTIDRNNSILKVIDNNKTGLYTIEGNQLFDTKYDDIFYIGLKYALGKIDDNYYILDLNNKNEYKTHLIHDDILYAKYKNSYLIYFTNIRQFNTFIDTLENTKDRLYHLFTSGAICLDQYSQYIQILTELD